METYNSHISKLDNEIIELLSIRQGLLTNSKNFKVLELGGYNLKNTFVSKIDHNIFKYELQIQNNKQYSYKKLFNENLDSNIEDYETLNLNRIIKQSYLIFLYDLCEYGDDEQNEFACKLDMELLFKIRIHFGYEMIKLKYLENIDFYDKLFQIQIHH